MASLRFPSLLLIGFLLVFQTLVSSHAHQGSRRMKWNSLMSTNNIASVQKDEISATQEVGKGAGQLGGRKKAVAVMEKGSLEKENGEIIFTSKKTTGKDMNASMESLQEPHHLLNNQNNSEGDETRTLESQSSKNMNPQSKTGSSADESLELEGSSNSNNKEEWPRILEEANEKITQLMRRDYGGMTSPRRKPPVNNNEPND